MENEQTYPELEKAKAEQEKLKLHHLSIDLTLEGMPGEIDLPKGERGERGQDGFTPVVTVTDNEDGSHLITITQPEGRGPITTTIKDGKVGPAGERGSDGLPGAPGRDGVAGSPGRDGFTPEVTVTDREDGTHVITITQPEGRAPITTTIKDGKPGAPGRDGVDGQSITGAKGDPGRDGFTPTITVTDKEDGTHVITITQPEGRAPITTTIKDGKPGAPGRDGVDGQSITGAKGDPGRDGFTPTITVTDKEDGTHVITITQPDGRAPITTTIKDGKAGVPGRDGLPGDRGLPAESPVTLADIMRLDRVKSHNVSYLFTTTDYDGVLFAGQHYLKEGRQNGYHWWADLRSTYDNDLEVKMEKLTDTQLRKTMVIDYDGATYDITRFNRTGGYNKNPGEFWTALTKAFRTETAIQPDISISTAVYKLTRAMNFKGSTITGYMYTIHTGYSVNNKFYLIVDKRLETHNNPNWQPTVIGT